MCVGMVGRYVYIYLGPAYVGMCVCMYLCRYACIYVSRACVCTCAQTTRKRWSNLRLKMNVSWSHGQIYV